VEAEERAGAVRTERDYYQILGIDRSAGQAEVQRAFRSLAKRYHPDHNPGDPGAAQRFKEIREAYEVLSDPERRRRYDRASTPEPPRAPAGRDLVQDLSVSLEDAFHGTSRRLAVIRRITCGFCRGTGGGVCPGCRGLGVATRRWRWERETCSRCGGRGWLPGTCHACAGRGLREEVQVLWVRIPAGVDTGSRIRLSGMGDVPRPGAPPGDLYLRVRVQTHARFYRSGRDLSCWVDVSPVRAALGGRVWVPTMLGTRAVRIPPGTRSGTAIRLEGMGMPDLRSGRRGVQWVFLRLSRRDVEGLGPLELGWLRLHGWSREALLGLAG